MARTAGRGHEVGQITPGRHRTFRQARSGETATWRRARQVRKRRRRPSGPAACTPSRGATAAHGQVRRDRGCTPSGVRLSRVRQRGPAPVRPAGRPGSARARQSSGSPCTTHRVGPAGRTRTPVGTASSRRMWHTPSYPPCAAPQDPSSRKGRADARRLLPSTLGGTAVSRCTLPASDPWAGLAVRTSMLGEAPLL
jgi:hypothetical protein